MRIIDCSALVLALTLCVSGIAQAKDKKAMPKMSPEMQAKMAEMQKLMAPGAGHEVLKSFVGEWRVKSTMWMEPGAEPQHSKGRSSFRMILGGRYIKQDFRGNWMGKPFKGVGHMGYDNVRKKYLSSWIDNASTSMMQGSATYDEASKTFTESGDYSCAMTGDAEKTYRAEWKMVDRNKHVYTMYNQDEAGKEYKAMEIVYTRKRK